MFTVKALAEKFFDGHPDTTIGDVINALCDGEALTAIGCTDDDQQSVETLYDELQNYDANLSYNIFMMDKGYVDNFKEI